MDKFPDIKFPRWSRAGASESTGGSRTRTSRLRLLVAKYVPKRSGISPKRALVSLDEMVARQEQRRREEEDEEFEEKEEKEEASFKTLEQMLRHAGAHCAAASAVTCTPSSRSSYIYIKRRFNTTVRFSARGRDRPSHPANRRK